MKTQKGDFVEIKYVGKLEDGSIFDLNDKERAKAEKINSHLHEKTVICLGEQDVVSGLDSFLIDKDIGKKLEIKINPEQGFGKKDAKLIQMIPLHKFKEQNINPMPGLKVNIDEYTGVIKSISGGRVLVDFNHPLAGRTLFYEITITKKVESVKEKVTGFLEMHFHLHDPILEEEEEGNLTLKAPLPKEMQEMLEKELKKRIPELKSIKIEETKQKE